MNPIKPVPFPKKFEAAYVFNDSVCRLFMLLAETHNIEILNKKTKLPFIFASSPFPIEFSIKSKEITSADYSKKISWVLENANIPCPIEYNFDIIPNTLENTTLLIFQIIITSPEKINVTNRRKLISGCRNVCAEMINNIETMLKVNNDNIYDYGSLIINGTMEKVWDYLVSFNFINKENFKIEGTIGEVGCIYSWSMSDGKDIYKGKVTYVSRNENKKKWKYKVIPIDKDAMLQEICFVVMMIDNNKTFLSISHEFKEQITTEQMNSLIMKKKLLLNNIKMGVEERGSNVNFDPEFCSV